jgi:hypothetical protein
MARKKIDKIRRSFLWKGEENANGRHCLVNWPIVTRPKDIGGLGIPDLEKFGRGLRLRWLGRNGPTIPNHGQVPNFLAVMMIASSLKPQPPSRFVTELRLSFGMTTGWMGRPPRALLHICSS